MVTVRITLFLQYEDVDVCKFSLGAFVLDVKTYTVHLRLNLATESTNAMMESQEKILQLSVTVTRQELCCPLTP